MERKILDELGQTDYRPVSAGVLADGLGVSKKEMPEFREALEALLASGQVKKNSQGLLRLRPAEGLVTGIVKKTAGGFGYVIPRPQPNVPASEDIFIAVADMADAHTGDEVLVRVLKAGSRRDGQPRGRIVDVLERAVRTFVGTYFERSGQGYVQVDGTVLADPIAVGDPGAKGPAVGDKVVFDMLRYPTAYRSGEGVLTQVLGPRGAPGVDTLSIMAEFGLPAEFPEDALEEARTQAEQFRDDDLAGRRDLTQDVIITIDPVDARDFDDAISLTIDPETQHWQLGVHIADVAHFVREGTPLDREAYKRGTSVYLPGRVIPMLPEVISNGLASLQAGKVRYTKSVFIEFTPEGIPVHTEVVNSAIRATQRFAYEQVYDILQHPAKHREELSPAVFTLLQHMHKLAMLLRKRRFDNGALELTMPEVKIDLDREGDVAGAHVVPHDVSHQIIEEFMLAANVAVAEGLALKKLLYLRRTHGDPDEAKLKQLADFVKTLGYPFKRFQSRLDLQKLLDKVADTPHQHAVNYALLRSMKQAEYSPEEVGHYALAVENYLHFTSPIRRYPDLIIHRQVDELIRRPHAKSPSFEALQVAGQHCSLTERKAAQAERELIKIKLLTYMETRVGIPFAAIITGVQEFGCFCQCIEVPVEGLVHISSLDDDYYYYEAGAQSLVGRRKGRTLTLGGRVTVVAVRVEVDKRILDFALADSRPGREAIERRAELGEAAGAQRSPTRRPAPPLRGGGGGKPKGRPGGGGRSAPRPGSGRPTKKKGRGGGGKRGR